MPQMTEIRWHGRGGQGVVTAAELLAETALQQGLYFQAFPEFGAERAGAPIRAFTRLSDQPLTMHCNITNPDIVLVLDPTLIGRINVTEGIKETGVVIVNSDRPAAEVRQQLGLKDGKLFIVNATRIAIDTIGRPIPNVPILGALVRATSIFPIRAVTETLRERFSHRFSANIVRSNVDAITRGYDEVEQE